MLVIKVLGSGCDNCKKVEAVARQAVAKLGIEAQVEKVTEYADIKKYPILSTPGLVINEKLVSAGRIPTEAEVTTWLTSALEAA
jgi:small redox-active disulfide protein 2